MAKSFRFPVEWRKPEHIPFFQLHSFTNLSPPLISQPCRFRSAVKAGSFPPGEAKGEVTEAGSIQCTYLFRERRGVKSPYHLQIVSSRNRSAIITKTIAIHSAL